MGQHIIHILRHGSSLHKERGMMVCRRNGDAEKNEIPIEDIRAVIIAANGVNISLELVSALMENNAVVLHCGRDYQPVGVSAGVERVIKSDALYNQANPALKVHKLLWNRVLTAKIANQAYVLGKYGEKPAPLLFMLENDSPDESFAARYYWENYFPFFNLNDVRRREDDEKNINAKLNYGYAVLSAIIHRSIIAHGLSPVFGMHHTARYKAHAMVYDLMEPWRPFIDNILVSFERSFSPEGGEIAADMEKWARHIVENMKTGKIKVYGSLRGCFDAIDSYISDVAKCYAEKNPVYFQAPLI